MASTANEAQRVRVRVWDWPTRLFHWSLAVCVVAAVVSAKIGGNALVWHLRFGVMVLALLVFRLAWGVAGGHWSRFASFVPTPGALKRYLRGEPRPGEHLDVGHSPTGALAVFALLGLLIVQVSTGLVADDEIATTGPLIRYVESATSALATTWHKTWGQWLLLLLVVLHLAAIVYYRAVRQRDLVSSMLHGDKFLDAPAPASRDDWRTHLRALILLGLGVAFALWVMAQGG